MSKKLLTIILSLFMVLTTLPVSVFAENESVEELKENIEEVLIEEESAEELVEEIIEEAVEELVEEIEESEPEVKEMDINILTWKALQDAINATDGDDKNPAEEATLITLTNDLAAGETDSAIEISEGKKIILDLNGYALDRRAVVANGYASNFVTEDSVIKINGGELTINDSNPDLKHSYREISNSSDDGTGLILLDKTASSNLSGGVITGGNADNGAGICVNAGKLTMNAGTIIGNYAKNCGAAVMVNSGSTFVMTDGTISNNVANKTDGKGGAVYIVGPETLSPGTFSMTGGIIANNNANYGAGIYNNAGTLNVENASIINNSSGVCNVDDGANHPSMSVFGNVQINNNGDYNLETSDVITVKGSLTGSVIYISHIDNTGINNTGVLTNDYSEKNVGAKFNDFFFYEGDMKYYMQLNTEGTNNGELEVKEIPENNYLILIPSFENGYISADKYYAKEGDTVTFIVHPYTGFETNKNGVFVDGGITISQDKYDPNKFSFVMPGNSVKLNASFKKSIDICENDRSKKSYSSITEAVKEALDGDTIKLISGFKLNYSIKIDKNIIIDGNKKYITFDFAQTRTITDADGNTVVIKSAEDIFDVTGKLTLQNITINSISNVASVHGKDAELTIAETATLNATSSLTTAYKVDDAYCIKAYDGAKLTVNGKLTNKYGCYPTVVIDNGDSKNTTEVIINDGANISGQTGIYQKAGKLTIKKATIIATGLKADFIVVEETEDEEENTLVGAEETVATVNPNTGDAVVIDNSNGGTPTVEITGGYFYSTNNNPIASYTDAEEKNPSIKNFVTCGYFNKELDDNLLYSDKYVDYSCVDNNDEETKTKYPYTVEMDSYVAQIGTDKYTSLEKALADVNNKETINLLKNITSTETFTFSKVIKFSIDSKGFTNGVTIAAGEGYVLSTETKGNVTTYRIHSHGEDGWNYSIKDNVLTATCKDCNGETPYSVSATITNDGGTYNGEQYAATIENKTDFETITGASIKAMYRKDKSTRASETAPINAGTYTCYIVVDGLKTREYASKKFTIAKATPTVTALPTASTITYGQSLKDSKLTGGIGSVAGKFTWKNGNTKPNATNGTEYKVVFTPTDSNNYSSVEVNVSVKVNKADYRTAVALNDWTYGQKSNNPRVSYNPENGNVTYTYAKEGSDEFTAIKPTNAGKYVVKANIAETANYNSAEATYRFEIRKANGSGSVSVKDFTYTGRPETKPDVKLSSTTLDASKATYKFYTKNQRGLYVEVKPTIWNAGTYYVRAEFKSNNNYNAYTTDYVKFVVKKADVNYKKPEKNVLTYNGQDQTLIKAGGSFDGTMYYTLKYDVRHPERTIWTDNVKNITGKNAGEYTVYYYVKGDNNHNDSNVETIKVEIAKKKLEVVWSKTVEFTYNSQLQVPTATLKGVIGEEEVILGYRYRQGMNTNAQPIDAGKYIATTYLNENVKANSNYELIENTTKCFFKINKKVLTATWETLSFKYDGTNKKPTLILNGVEDKDIDGVNATIRVKGNAVEEGFYKVKASLDNKNYSLEEMRTIFFIFDDEPMHDGTITTGSVNSDKQRFLSTYTYKITEDNLDDILAYETSDKDAADKDAVVDALDNNGSIHFFTKVETTEEEDKSAFTEYSLNDNNAIFFDVNLYASIDGDTKVRQLFNTNGYNVKVELTLTGDEASKIVGSRKNYYLLREHDGKVEKVDVDVKKNLDDGGNLISCTITFESNKFSTFALYSKNKPTPTPYIAPKTGIN